ncbi:MAG: alpha/beta hydrolase fold domain-containing protein [Flavobacteriales bacterium]|nr:alpha/beta hydrolase fold domain-containing protein [Flavobacteriales bacterium]
MLKLRPALILLVSVTVLLVGCFHLLPKGTDVHLNESYGPDQRNKLDMYLPDVRDTSTKTVMLIHGGAWVAGDKGGAELKDVRNQLLEAGYAVASMNYRYACGDYHKQMEDVGNALNHIVAHADGWKIGSSRFALMGYSAGGHLALLYAHVFDEQNLVQTVISNVGPTDLTDSLFRQYAANYNLSWTLEQLIGATYEEDSSLYAEASPLFNWSDCPTLLIYGGMDDLVPEEQGVAMFDTLMVNGVITDTIIPIQGTHNVYGPNNIYKQRVDQRVLDWLQNHL